MKVKPKPWFAPLSRIMKISTILGIVPNYNFKSRKITYKMPFKLYSVFLSLALSALCIFTLHIRHTDMHKDQSYQVWYLDVVMEIVGLATFLITTLSAAFWNMETWRKLINQLRSLEHNCSLNAITQQMKSSLRKGNIIFILGTAYYICLYTAHGINTSLCTILMLSSTMILFYMEYVLSNLAFNIIVSIKSQYGGVSDMLRNYPLDGMSGTLNRARKLYLATSLTVQTFNKVFGWFFVGLFFHMMVQILECLLMFTVDKREKTVIFTVIVVCYLSILMLGPLMVIFSCDLTVKEAAKLAQLCSKMHQYISPDSRESIELARLENHVKIHSPVFSAAGFFPVNRSTLLSLLSTTTTYFIVAIQFKN